MNTLKLAVVLASFALVLFGCRVEYAPPPVADGAGVTNFIFTEDADPTIALLDYVKTQLLVQPYPGAEGDQVAGAIAAAGALVHYLRATQKADLAHVRAITYRRRADALLIVAEWKEFRIHYRYRSSPSRVRLSMSLHGRRRGAAGEEQ